MVDLTHTLRPDFPTFDGKPAIEIEPALTVARDGYAMNRLAYLEHVGTRDRGADIYSTCATVTDYWAMGRSGRPLGRVPVDSTPHLWHP